MNQIINMILRRFMRQGINMGITKGIDYFYRNKNVDDTSANAAQNREQAKGSAKNAKQTMRMIRRIGRF